MDVPKEYVFEPYSHCFLGVSRAVVQFLLLSPADHVPVPPIPVHPTPQPAVSSLPIPATHLPTVPDQVDCSSGSQHQIPPHHGSYPEVADRQAISEEVVYRDSVCRLCSDDSHTARHHHISSEASRAFAMKYQGGYRFYCIMCKGDESVVRPSTRKVILTTSTLIMSGATSNSSCPST